MSDAPPKEARQNEEGTLPVTKRMRSTGPQQALKNDDHRHPSNFILAAHVGTHMPTTCLQRFLQDLDANLDLVRGNGPFTNAQRRTFLKRWHQHFKSQLQADETTVAKIQEIAYVPHLASFRAQLMEMQEHVQSFGPLTHKERKALRSRWAQYDVFLTEDQEAREVFAQLTES